MIHGCTCTKRETQQNYTFDEGKYEFYVEPGEYEIKVSLDSGMVTAADVTITNASVERNLELGE